MRKKVFITGMGCVSAAGNNCCKLLSALQEGRTGIGASVCFNRRTADIKAAAEIETIIPGSDNNGQVMKRIGNIFKRPPPIAIQSAIISIWEALDMAGVPSVDLSKTKGRAGLVVGGSNLTQNGQYLLYQRYGKMTDYVPATYAVEFMDTNFLGVLSEIFGVTAEGFCVGGASASGNIAILQAYRLIAYGMLDACIVVAPAADLSPLELQAFVNLGALANVTDLPEQSCRPFDQKHAGFILGQGSGAILLESAEAAAKRGIKPWAEILGGAVKLDGNHLPDARAAGEQACMEQALSDAKITAPEIDYINAHGTSTPLGDRMEATAIAGIFTRNRKRPWINSSKSILGHCLASAAILETIATLLQMKHDFLHPNLNLDTPIEECEGLSLVGKNMIEQEIGTALNNSFGFGGINTTVVLRKTS